MLYLLRTSPITLSTCILVWAIFRVDSNSKGDNCFFPRVNAGILTSTQHIPTLSEMSNTRSAKTISPGRSFDKSLQFSVIKLSDMRPPYPLERNEMAP